MVLSLLLACSCALVASGPTPCERIEVNAVINTDDKMPSDVRAKMMDELACDCEELRRKYEECPGVQRVQISVEMPSETKCPCNKPKPKAKDADMGDEVDKCGCNKPKPKGEEVKSCSSCNKPCGSCTCGCKSEEVITRKCKTCCKQKCGCRPKCSTCCTGCNSACNSCCKTCC